MPVLVKMAEKAERNGERAPEQRTQRSDEECSKTGLITSAKSPLQLQTTQLDPEINAGEPSRIVHSAEEHEHLEIAKNISFEHISLS